MHAGVAVEFLQRRKHRALWRVRVEVVQFGVHADFLAGTYLVAEVNFRDRMIADLDRGEPRPDIEPAERCDALLQLGVDFPGGGHPVNDPGGARCSS